MCADMCADMCVDVYVDICVFAFCAEILACVSCMRTHLCVLSIGAAGGGGWRRVAIDGAAGDVSVSGLRVITHMAVTGQSYAA